MAVEPVVVQRGEMMLPDVDKAARAMVLFQELKKRVLDSDDVQTISGKAYIKRSGWRKIAFAFNVDTQVVSVEKELLDAPKGWTVTVKARAVSPGGRIAEDVATCDAEEIKKSRMEPTLHNIETKAATRAINRAISDLVGGGIVSAEELNEAEQAQEPPHPQEKPPKSFGPPKAFPAQVNLIVQAISKSPSNALTVTNYLGERGLKNPQELNAEQATELIDSLQEAKA